MHFSRVTLVVLLLLAISLTTAKAASLVSNGSFEELGVSDRPVGFSTWVGQGSPGFGIEIGEAHSGQNSFRISGDGAARGSINCTLPFEGGTYKMSLWYRVSASMPKDGVVLRLMAFHSHGSSENDKVQWSMSEVAPAPGTRVQLNGNNLHVIADQSLVAGEWYPLSVTFSLPDEVQRLQVNIFNWLGNGTVWFDDVHLEATTFDWIAYQETAMRELEARELEGPSMLTTLHDQHPRLLVSSSDLAHLRQLIENEPQAREWYTALKISATNVLLQPVSQYEIPDGKRLLATSRRVLDRVLLLAFVYHMEEDVRFAERAWKELEAAAHFPDWNPSHFLDTAEMTHAFAIGYDWLYHVWTPEQRDVLRNAIAHMGLEPGLHAYRGTAPYGWWVNVTHNWNLVCNGGLAMGALAIADEEPRLAELILRAGIKSAPAAIAQFAPDGGWDEGVGYWHYSIRYLIPYIAALESALSSSFGLAEVPGLELAGTFPMYLTSPAGVTFNFADGGTGVVNAPELFWMARRFEQPSYAWWHSQVSGGKASVLALVWYAQDLLEGFAPSDLPLDKHFGHIEVASMRSSWEEKDALFVGWKAGDLKANHGDLDLGSFVLDALGVRWAVDLGSDDYNMPGYFGSQRWSYYRKRAEGHNTLVLDPSAAADQDPAAVARIVFYGASDGEAVSIADLTPGYRRHASSVKRGIALIDGRSQVLVQDEIEAPHPSEIWWFMHTRANVSLDGDGSTAILEQGGKRLAVRVLSPEGAAFTVMPAAPLPTSPNPSVQAVNHDVRKLAIQLHDVTSTCIAVQLVPLIENEAASVAPVIKPLHVWQETIQASERLWPALGRITVDVSSPPERGQTVRGVIPVDIELSVPTSGRLEKVSVLVDGEPLFSGPMLPEELLLDTYTLTDGIHRLLIEATVNGTLATRAFSFRVENWWNITDRMEPPLETGWFGTLVRSQTSSESDGWRYTTGISRTQLGGADRRIREHDTEEHLTWETPNLRSVKIIVQAPRTAVGSALELLVSQNGQEWDSLAYTVQELELSPEGLHELALVAELPAGTSAHWCRLRVLPGHFAPDELQIAQAELTGLRK